MPPVGPHQTSLERWAEAPRGPSWENRCELSNRWLIWENRQERFEITQPNMKYDKYGIYRPQIMLYLWNVLNVSGTGVTWCCDPLLDFRGNVTMALIISVILLDSWLTGGADDRRWKIFWTLNQIIGRSWWVIVALQFLRVHAQKHVKPSVELPLSIIRANTQQLPPFKNAHSRIQRGSWHSSNLGGPKKNMKDRFPRFEFHAEHF